MPLTVRSKLIAELLPIVHAGVRAAHLRSHYADDAVQQSLLALVPHVDRLALMPDAERRAYVFVSASRTAIGFRKRLGSNEALGTDAEVREWAARHGVPFQEVRTPERDADFIQRAARAESALGAMTTQEREVIRAVAHDGLSERQAADHLGISRGGVGRRLRRAREILGRAWSGTTSWARQRSRT